MFLQIKDTTELSTLRNDVDGLWDNARDEQVFPVAAQNTERMKSLAAAADFLATLNGPGSYLVAGEIEKILRVLGATLAPITFEQFQATGRPCDDLATATGNTDEIFSSNVGRLYGDAECPLYIEEVGGASPLDGNRARWYTMVERSEYESDDLAALERRLYEFAVEAGYLEEAP